MAEQPAYLQHSAINLHKESINNVNLPPTSSTLRILQINIRGMNKFNKLDSLCLAVQELKQVIDVIVVGETWIKKDRAEFYNVPGYRSTHSCRKTSAGGLAIFVRNGLRYDQRKNIAVNGYHHIELLLHTSKPISLHGIYRPPDFDSARFTAFIEEIVSTARPNQPCFVVGDMNVPVNDQDNRETRVYTQLLSSYNMIVTNNQVTRPASNNILDHVVCSMEESASLTNYTIDCPLSDHSYVLTVYSTKERQEIRTLRKTLVNQRRVNEQFGAFLRSMQLDMLSVNERLVAVTDKYREILQGNTTELLAEVKVKNNCCPWYNYDMWKLGKIKDNVYHRWKSNRRDSNLTDLLAHINRRFAACKKKAKIEYYQRQLNTTNPKTLWSRINEILGRKQKKDTSVKLVVDETEVHEPTEVAEALNKYFAAVGENLASSLESDGDINRFNTIKRKNLSIFLRPSSKREVKTIIDGLNVSKATGYDGFPVLALKLHSELLSSLISRCFNDSVSQGSYPPCLKSALVIPIFKKGDPLDPTNYRPISVLPAINKVFEKLVYSRLLNFFCKTKLLYPHQFGFRQGSSTEVAVLELVDEISRALDRKMLAGSVFLDLSKAFDTINHPMLLKKLDAYGVRGLPNDYLRSYLTDRQQQVVVSGSRSVFLNIRTGVPQGSNLGPLLFLVYVNDIAELHLSGKVKLFADDTVLLYENKSPGVMIQLMKIDMECILGYLGNNLLALNLEKTKMMLFRNSQTVVPPHPPLNVANEVIEEVQSFKYLGVHLDNRLTWRKHIDEVVSSCSALCGILRKLAWILPQHALLKIYYAFINSKYQYGIAIWGTACRTFLKDVQTQQNRCIKAIFRLPFLYPTFDLYASQQHSILPILGMFKLKVSVLMYKIETGQLHHNWRFTRAVHQHFTRQAGDFQQERFRTEIGRRRFTNLGADIYNQVPDLIKNLPELTSFKSRLKYHLKEHLSSIL